MAAGIGKLRRIAIAENMRVIALLVESETPHSKELATIMLVRIKALLNDPAAYPTEATDDDIAAMLTLAEAVGA